MPNNCFCDQRGIGDPTQTCGDCPEDYLERDNGGIMNDKNLDSGPSDEVPCSTHPDAPHGFNRNASHTEDRYVCDCEGWEPPLKPPLGVSSPLMMRKGNDGHE